MKFFSDWTANEWTALFTGLTVLAMAFGYLQNRRMILLTAAPMIPEPQIQYSADGTILVYVPKDSLYAISKVEMSPKFSCISALVGSETRNEYGDVELVRAGRLKALHEPNRPTKQLSFAVIPYPDDSTLVVTLMGRNLPTQRIPILLKDGFPTNV
ncbi:hypothetical protein MCHK_10080 [Mesorhizobium huakuii 7653R]|nr:hypothetical protein MCHK_10080 [Mesorhizobium huakuii 7653R]